MSETDDTEHVVRLRDLARLDIRPVGSRVLIQEDGILYHSIGSVPDDIAYQIGWPSSMNVWMPEHVVQYVLDKRSNAFPSPVLLAATLIEAPLSVHLDTRWHDARYFFGDGDVLREREVLHSVSTRYVDAAIELRQVPGGSLLRLFHLSPRRRNLGGKQLWPHQR